MPVPSVITHSTPRPAITPRPCTVASLAKRAGLPNRSASVAASGKPCHASVPRLGAVSTLAVAHHAGKPDGDPLEPSQRPDDAGQRLHHHGGGRGMRRVHPRGPGDHVPVGGEHAGLQMGATDIDGKRQGSGAARLVLLLGLLSRLRHTALPHQTV